MKKSDKLTAVIIVLSLAIAVLSVFAFCCWDSLQIAEKQVQRLQDKIYKLEHPQQQSGQFSQLKNLTKQVNPLSK